MPEKIKVQLEDIKYFGLERLEVAVDRATKEVYLTGPGVESILNYEPNNARKKIASKSLKAFLGEGRTVGKSLGTIENSALVGATATVTLYDLQSVSLLALWESSVNQNPVATRLLLDGFERSIRDLAFRQLGISETVEEILHWHEKRVTGIDIHKALRDSDHEAYLAAHPDCEKVPFYVHTNRNDLLNVLLTGQKAKYWVDKFGLKKSDELRSLWGVKQLDRIQRLEDLALTVAEEEGLSACDALREAFASLRYKEWPEDLLLGTDCPRTLDRNRKRVARSKEIG